MSVKELIQQLQKFNLELEIMVLDGSNAGGYPRTINTGPRTQYIELKDIEDCGDCEEFAIGEQIIAIGYGCY